MDMYLSTVLKNPFKGNFTLQHGTLYKIKQEFSGIDSSFLINLMQIYTFLVFIFRALQNSKTRVLQTCSLFT